jgi:hypothetical protein
VASQRGTVQHVLLAGRMRGQICAPIDIQEKVCAGGTVTHKLARVSPERPVRLRGGERAQWQGLGGDPGERPEYLLVIPEAPQLALAMLMIFIRHSGETQMGGFCSR